MDFPTEEEIYEQMEADLQTEVPSITNYSSGGIARSILYVLSLAIGTLIETLKNLYWNIFPQSADLGALRLFYEEWGLEWDENLTTEEARATILGKYRHKSIGTKGWYEETAEANFDEVTEAKLEAGIRGPNTLDLTVSYHLRPVGQSVLNAVQAYFDDDANKVATVDLLVKTVGEVEEI